MSECVQSLDRITNAFNRQVVADDFSDLYRAANKAILDYGIESSPRGLKIKELINFTAILTNPRARLLKSEARGNVYKYSVAELLWYLRGSNSLEEIAFYAPTLRQFSDNGETLNSAYGERIFGTHKDFPNQWKNVVSKLVSDRDTRQAIININYAEDQNRATKDVTCTLNLQFFIRENRLHMITHMRSNDFVLGNLHDTFCFTMFQELLLIDLRLEDRSFNDVELGYYIHNVGSAHIYERHFTKVKNIINEADMRYEPMKPLAYNHSGLLQMIERDVRNSTLNKSVNVDEILNTLSDGNPWKQMIQFIVGG